MLAVTLPLSVFALAAGFGLLARRPQEGAWRFAVSGFALGAVPALIATELLPRLWSQFGWITPGLIATGYGLLWATERASAGARGERLVLAVLAMHASLDGASLAVSDAVPAAGRSAVLAAAIVLHRLPEGLAVRAVLAPRHGLRVAALGAGVLALATIAGALGGRQLLDRADAPSVGVAIAVSMGALLGAVLHHHPAGGRSRLAARALGAALGVGLAWGLPDAP